MKYVMVIGLHFSAAERGVLCAGLAGSKHIKDAKHDSDLIVKRAPGTAAVTQKYHTKLAVLT